MTATEPTQPLCGVVAQWAEPHGTTRASDCSGCGEHLDVHTIECPQCRQHAGRITGMLAQVIETTSGQRQLVVSARTDTGGWEAVRTVPATDEAVRMIRFSAAGANTRAEARAAGRHDRTGVAGQGVLA